MDSYKGYTIWQFMFSTCALAAFHQNLVAIDLGNSIDGKSLSYDLNDKAVLSATPNQTYFLTEKF